MGSMPNLHVCSSEDATFARQPLSAQRSNPDYYLLSARRSGHRSRTHSHQRRCAKQQQLAKDDINVEAASSPVSCRSNRSYCRTHRTRLDSLSGSSAGGTSVRHLISLVRTTPSALGPVYSERALLRLHSALCLAAASTAAAVAPPLSLAPSVLRAGPPLGAACLPALSHAMAALSAVAFAAFGPALLRRAGPSRVAALAHLSAAGFTALHLPPATAASSAATVFSLAPAYVLLGLLSLGPLPAAHAAFLSAIASKLSVSDVAAEPSAVLTRLARHLQLSQHFGQVLGNGAAALILWFTLTPTAPADLEPLFATDDSGRICGSSACPVPALGTRLTIALPPNTSALLAAVLLCCCFIGTLTAGVFLGRVRLFPRSQPTERLSPRNAARTLAAAFADRRFRLIAPLFLFIGMEQAFMIADFPKFYVSCSLGLPEAALSSLAVGLLQSLAAFILSILLQHIQRYVVIVAGFLFHSCLLLVLLMWKASGDDPALFYVISAAWGVCNAIWEVLTFTLLVSAYPCEGDSWQGALALGQALRLCGLALALSLHHTLCTSVKVYVLSAALPLSVAPYAFLEARLQRKRRRAPDILAAL